MIRESVLTSNCVQSPNLFGDTAKLPIETPRIKSNFDRTHKRTAIASGSKILHKGVYQSDKSARNCELEEVLRFGPLLFLSCNSLAIRKLD